MDAQQLLIEVNEIFKEVMDNEDIQVNMTTSAKDIEEWDSLTHIQLIVGVEKQFKIRFTSSEIQNFKNVGEMCATIASKIGNSL
jgi:acyl carrier protein